MSVITEKQLGQRRDNDTSTHTVYQVPTGKSARITQITLCNLTTSDKKIKLFKSTATTYDESTAMLWNVVVPGNGILELSENRYLEANGSIGYQQITANAITITVDGLEITL